MSQFFASGGQSIGVTASSLVLPMNIQDWFPLGWTGWISLQSKGLSRVFSNTTAQKHQFFGMDTYNKMHGWKRFCPMLLDNCVFIFITATRNKIQNISVTQESAFNASHPKGDHFLIYQLVSFVCYRTSLNKIIQHIYSFVSQVFCSA